MDDGPDTQQVDTPQAEGPRAEAGQAELPGMGAPAPAPVPDAPEGDLKSRAIEAISTVYDPEIPVNIYELGLIYEVNVSPENNIAVQMTLTSPHCPVAEWLPMEVQRQVICIEGVNDVTVDIVWDPPWRPDMMSEAAKLELGFM